MKSYVIRQKWLDFFQEKGHTIEPSASLVPHNDPSLLWVSAGMVPLKAYFDGRISADNPRIANAQKCIRTNDIENVGKTKRHHTFFEMLGNFSIGDYFKEETITWSWEFLTDPKWIGFDPDRLSATVHPDDQEAYDLWHHKIGLPPERIVKLEDNFWDIGEGPCGPCTEIFYDRGEAYGDLSDPECYPGGENERFLEVWNNVFSQYNHNKDGSYTPLPKKNIDTGAGLERFASILQDVDSNFDTDLFQPIIQKTCQLCGVTYGAGKEMDIALKVIADHIRAVSFAVGDGVLPSNEGRGYVLRRLLRRAVRYGRVLGINRPFLYELVPVVAEIMGMFYHELVDQQAFIVKTIRIEEERFHETLADGLHILEQIVTTVMTDDGKTVSGEDAFRLYDTYGFPLDLTEDFAAERGLTVDRAGFETAMEAQRDRARSARQDRGSMKVQGGPLQDIEDKSEFTGYTDWKTEAKVLVMIADEERVESAGSGSVCHVILDRTPFYAESGGQISDRGTLENGHMSATVEEVYKAPHGQHVHQIRITAGKLSQGDTLTAAIDVRMRDDIVKNHTATHLLHKALKQVLGTHVNQAGSLVAPDRLRFDFSHFGAITHEELKQIERLVNEQIWNNTAVLIQQKPIDEAKQMGAMALFGEKYGDIVRVVQVADYSIELCGGCHVDRTSQIGIFKIMSETGIGSGVRRIEACSGKFAFDFVETGLAALDRAGEQLKTSRLDVPVKVETLMVQIRELARETESLRMKLSHLEAGSFEEQVKQIDGIPLLSLRVDGADMDTLRTLADEIKQKLSSIILVLGASQDSKVHLVSGVTRDLIEQGYHAGQLIKEVASVCGGGGGGRPDMAQAGGKDVSKLNEALAQAEVYIRKMRSSVHAKK